MKALVKTQAGPGATLMEIDNPRPKKEEVLIKVKSVAICGTDIHFYDWDPTVSNFSFQFPLLLGHEYAGEILETGENVEGLSVGDRVAVETHIPCGKCYQCNIGNYHNCQEMDVVGITYPGAFAEYARVPAKVAFKLPAEVSYEEGSLFEPAGAAMHGVDEAGISAGDLVVILGCGPIGLAAVQMAQIAGSAQVLAIDINDFRLDMARLFGASTLNPLRDDVVQRVSEIAGRKGGADVILEVSGAPAAFKFLFDLLRREGKLVAIGLLSDPINVNVSKNIVLKGIEIKGVFGRRIWETWEHLASLVEAKRINLSGIITHRFPLVEYEEAFRQVHGHAGKVVLTP
jgi:threonine 3-dehydrogenase